MDKYKTISAFNKWLSPINLEKLSIFSKKSISAFDAYRKKLDFKALLSLLLYGVNEERESLRDLSTSLTLSPLQKEIGLESISYSQISRSLNHLDSCILEEIFQQLLVSVQEKTRPNKRNSLYLIDSSTFSLSKKRHPWAAFRKTKSGVKLHLKLCFMNDETLYPTDFTLTNAKEHDVNQLELLVDQAEATYVFDRGYLDFDRMDQLHHEGYFFVTRIKKNTKYHIFEDFETPSETVPQIISYQHVALGSKTTLTSRFRLVTIEDEKGKQLQFITNRFDLSASEVSQAYKSRWQIELFFKHIKQHMTIKNFFSQSESGVHNQLILSMIAALLTFLIKVKTKTVKSIFQIKRLFRYAIFHPFEELFCLLVPS